MIRDTLDPSRHQSKNQCGRGESREYGKDNLNFDIVIWISIIIAIGCRHFLVFRVLKRRFNQMTEIPSTFSFTSSSRAFCGETCTLAMPRLGSIWVLGNSQIGVDCGLRSQDMGFRSIIFFQIEISTIQRLLCFFTSGSH